MQEVNGLDIKDLKILGKAQQQPAAHIVSQQVDIPAGSSISGEISSVSDSQTPIQSDPMIAAGMPVGTDSNAQNAPVYQPIPTHAGPIPLKGLDHIPPNQAMNTPPVQQYYNTASSTSTPQLHQPPPPPIHYASQPFEDPAILSAVPISTAHSQQFPSVQPSPHSQQAPAQQMMGLSLNNNNAYPPPYPSSSHNNALNMPDTPITSQATPAILPPSYYPVEQQESADDGDSDSSTDPNPYTADVDFEALEDEERRQKARHTYKQNDFFEPQDQYYANGQKTEYKGPKAVKPKIKSHSKLAFDDHNVYDVQDAKSAKGKARRPRRKERYEEDEVYYEVNKTRGFGGRRSNNKNDRYLSNNSGYSGHVRSQSGFDSDGWAGEDLMDIKEQEFDFQANNDRFNKREVFDEIRQQDTTDPNQRLVAFNKNPSRQVNGNGYQTQQKYGNREMVLKRKNNARWAGDEQEDDDTEYVDGDEDPDRSIDATIDEEEEEEEDTGVESDSLYVEELPEQQYRRRQSLAQVLTDVKFITPNTGKAVPCASPVQMVELERLSSITFGISESSLNENAGRGIAEITLKHLGGSSRFAYSNHNLSPTVIIFAGNTRSGLRALTAGRHLANRQVHVIAMVVGYNEGGSPGDGEELMNTGSVSMTEFKEHIKALRSSTARVVKRYDELLNELKTTDSPPELIIDGLQGYQNTLDDFGERDVATVINCIDWANRQRAPKASLDIPSGIDGATGMTLTRNKIDTATNGSANGRRWPHIKANIVLSCGLPVTGLENAYMLGITTPEEWKHYIVDVGLPTGALQKGNLRRFGKVWFGSYWFQQLDVITKPLN